MSNAQLSQKPHLGPKVGRRRSIRKKRSLSPWSHRRKPRVKRQQASGRSLYLYNQSGQLIAELDETGTTVREYIYLDNGEPLALIENNNIYYYHNDHIGTPQTITDNSQNIVWDATYTPFGEATIHTETITNNIRLPGQYWDVETELHHNGWRPYDFGLGRYTQSDPIGLLGGLNTYLYVNANPVRFIDPDGLLAINPITAKAVVDGVTAIAGILGIVNILGNENDNNVIPFPDPNPTPESEPETENCPPELCPNTLQAKLREIPWNDPLHDKLLPSPIPVWHCEYTCADGYKFSMTISNRLGCPSALPRR